MPPFAPIFLDDPAVGEKFFQIAPHGPVTGRVWRAEIDQQYPNATGGRNGVRVHSLRSSAMILPSFGNDPGATSFTAPLSLVTDCRLAAIARSSAASDAGLSASKVIVSWSSFRPTTRRRRLSSGWRAAISATCFGCTNMPLILAV